MIYHNKQKQTNKWQQQQTKQQDSHNATFLHFSKVASKGTAVEAGVHTSAYGLGLIFKLLYLLQTCHELKNLVFSLLQVCDLPIDFRVYFIAQSLQSPEMKS